MRISIAMATYNGARFLPEQLESFARQTRLPDQLVICDDRSTDDTVAIVEEFAKTAPFEVRLHRNAENIGCAPNFGRALSLSDGDLIFISDQDDIWYPEKIETVVEVHNRADGPIMTVNDQHIADGQGRLMGPTIFENSRKLGYSDEFLSAGACTALPRAMMDLVVPMPAQVAYDTWTSSIADSLGIKVVIEQPLQLFRRHGSNHSQPAAVEQRPNRLTELKLYGFSDPRPAWAQEIEWRTELLRRLKDRRAELLASFGQGIVDRALRVNERRIAVLNQRTELLGRPRWKRAGSVLRAWRQGVYREFKGAQSALKDLVRS